MTLRDLTQSIRTGVAPSVLEKAVLTGNAQPYGLVKMTNIPEHGGWITAPESNISADPGKRLDAVILEEGDVLISARGREGFIKIGVVGEEAAGAIADANVLIIRPLPGVNAGAIAAYLSSTIGLEQLRRSGRAASMLYSINPKQVSEIPFPRLTNEQMEAIGQLYFESRNYYEKCLRLAQCSLGAAHDAIEHLFVEQEDAV